MIAFKCMRNSNIYYSTESALSRITNVEKATQPNTSASFKRHQKPSLIGIKLIAPPCRPNSIIT